METVRNTVMGSSRTKTITARNPMGNRIRRLLRAGRKPLALKSDIPANRHMKIKIVKLIPGVFFQNRKSKEMPSIRTVTHRYFGLIIKNVSCDSSPGAFKYPMNTPCGQSGAQKALIKIMCIFAG